MVPTSSSLAGFRGLRSELLVAIKRSQPLTVKDLAERFSVTPNGLRRHLKALEEEGVVRYRREVRGVGGPVFAYSLTEAGEGLFPRDYVPALADALEVVREEQGVAGVVRIFQRRWAAIAEQAGPSLRTLPLPERAALLAELLSAQGYMAEAEVLSPTEATIREHNCAIRAVASRFPEVCAAEATFIGDVLGARVERRLHIATGCNVCEYKVATTNVEHGTRKQD